MSNLTKFADALRADAALKARVEAIDVATEQEAVNLLAALAHEVGIPLTPEELLAANQSGELDLDQLEAVSGGFFLRNDRYVPPKNPGVIHHIDP